MGVPFDSDYNLMHQKEKCFVSKFIINGCNKSDAVYKECSYSLPYKKLWKMKKSKNTTNADPKPEHLTEIVQSESINLRDLKTSVPDICVKQIEPIDLNADKVKNASHVYFEEINHKENKVDEADISQLTTETLCNNTDSLPKSKHSQTIRKKHHLPKVLCPCCTGGDDDIEEYESIEQQMLYNLDNYPLHLDPSLLSVLHMQRVLKKKKTAKNYPKLLKVLIHNTYKNTIRVFLHYIQQQI